MVYSVVEAHIIQPVKGATYADVVVVGAGTAGLSAALSASQACAKVILIDKNITSARNREDSGRFSTTAGRRM